MFIATVIIILPTTVMDLFYNNISNILVQFSRDPIENCIVTFETHGYHFGFRTAAAAIQESKTMNNKKQVFLYTGKTLLIDKHLLRKLPPPPINSIHRYFRRKRPASEDTIVLEIINHYALNSDGESHIVHCPFHTDNNPSLNVNLKEGVFYCFSCREGGRISRLWTKLKTKSTAFLPNVQE